SAPSRSASAQTRSGSAPSGSQLDSANWGSRTFDGLASRHPATFGPRDGHPSLRSWDLLWMDGSPAFRELGSRVDRRVARPLGPGVSSPSTEDPLVRRRS